MFSPAQAIDPIKVDEQDYGCAFSLVILFFLFLCVCLFYADAVQLMTSATQQRLVGVIPNPWFLQRNRTD